MIGALFGGSSVNGRGVDHMDGWIDDMEYGGCDGCMDIYGRLDIWPNGHMDIRTHGCMAEWMYGHMDKWMNIRKLRCSYGHMPI